MPTNKGVTLRVEFLPALINALQAAEFRAREMGLVVG